MTSVAVIDISGIGPALGAKLNELGLYTSQDLLRSDRARLAKLLDGASVAQVRQWQAVSELLEIEEMTLSRAEALHAGGIETLDELGASTIGKLRGVVGAGGPSDDQLVAWMKDAIVLRHTGTLNGTVLGSKGAPLEGVTATCMGKRVVSDARGRFRIRRLPLGRKLLVYLAHPDHNEKSIATGRIAAHQVLAGEQFRLTRRSPTTTTEPRTLSELRGDQLPSPRGAAITTRAQTSAPAPNDLLRVFEVPAAGGARAVSRWLDYEAGVFIARTYRLTATDVDGVVAPGDHLQFATGQWRRVAMNHHRLEAARRRLRAQRLRPVLPPNPTGADVARAMDDYMTALARDRMRFQR